MLKKRRYFYLLFHKSFVGKETFKFIIAEDYLFKMLKKFVPKRCKKWARFIVLIIVLL